MSRGLGKLQRRILEELERGHASAAQLVKCCQQRASCEVENNTYAALRSVQRAVRTLRSRGLIIRLPGRFLAVIEESHGTVHVWAARAHYCLPEHAERIAGAHRGRLQLFEDRCADGECHLSTVDTSKGRLSTDDNLSRLLDAAA